MEGRSEPAYTAKVTTTQPAVKRLRNYLQGEIYLGRKADASHA